MKLFIKTVVIIAIGCLALAGKPASAAKMIGYWEDWNSLPLASVSSNYDVVDVAFGLPGGTDNATIAFSETAESSTQFIADVKSLQNAGKKVILSIGGASAASLDLQNGTDVTSFVNSVEGLVTTYGFNGIDLDLENGALNLASGDSNLTSPTTPAVVNLITALGQLNSHYGSSFMITFAPQTLDINAYGQYAGGYGDYLPVFYATRGYMSYAAIQTYNSGGMFTATGGSIGEGTPDFQVAQSELLLHGYKMGNGQSFPAMTPSQVAFGVIATTAAGNASDGGYLAPASVLEAAKYLGSGTTYGGSYTLLGGPYPGFAGVMTWDANYDNGNGNAMSGALVSYLHSISGGGSPTEGPYNGTDAAIPGTVQAENYDTGGSGLGYSVSSSNGSANSYRSDGIDLETTTDTGGGYDLGWSAAGQWFRYTVNVSTAGSYTVSCRVANGNTTNATLHIQNSSGTNLSGTITVAPTGGWQTWATVTATVTLPAGQQTLTVSQDSGGYNMNYLAFAANSGSCTASPATPGTPTASGTTSSSTTVNWSSVTPPANCTITGYEVYKGGTALGSTTSTSYGVSGLSAGTAYSFTVAAIDSHGTGSQSGAVNVTTSSASCSATPSAPGTPTAGSTTSSGTTISWSAVTPPSNCSITGYEVYKGGTALGSTTSTSYAVTGLSASTAYSFTVAAIDSDGTGGQSGAVNVTTSSSGGGCSGIAAWSGNSVAYATGALVTYNGSEYKCLTGHTSEAGWDPVDVPSLWTLVGSC